MGELERSVLVAIIHLQGRGYAVSIADETSRRLNKSVSLGAIYGTTDRLEKKGFISSRLESAVPSLQMRTCSFTGMPASIAAMRHRK